jgi:LuxR family maltose regulon positive regulatory protein
MEPAHVREDTVLVLDDMQILRHEAHLTTLLATLDDPGSHLRLVLVGRGEEPAGVQRLRLAEQLTEIHPRQLAFRTHEIARLLAMRGRRPSTAQAVLLAERTEGWPAGVQLLAAPFLERRDDDLAEFPDALRDYLVREVLDPQPPEVRSFLLRTSVPQEISADLAAALTGETAGERLLEQLERTVGFVTRITGPHGATYRYHGLLREVLRRELEARSPAELSGLHVRSAQWYAGHRMTLRALAHAVAARDWPLLGRLAVEHALPMAFSGERIKLVEVLRQIPPAHLADTAELALCAALLLMIGDDFTAADDQLDRVRWMLTTTDPPHRLVVEPALRLWRTAARTRVDGDMTRLIDDTTRILSDLSHMRLDQVPGLLQYRAMALGLKGAALFWSDRADQADQHLWSASTAARASGVELIEISSLAHLAMLVYLQGSLREAERLVSAMDEVAARHDLQLARESAPAHLVSALIELERDRVTEAREALRRGMHATGVSPSAVLQIAVTLTRARLLLADGEPEAAREAVRRCADEVTLPESASLAGRWLRLTASEVDLALGDGDTVVARYSHREPSTMLVAAEQVMLARAYEMTGEHEAAEEIAARVRYSADVVSAVSAWVVTALAADAQGHTRRSADALAHAVLRAQTENVRRPFHRFDNRHMLRLAERQRWLYEERSPAGTSVLDAVEDERGFLPLPAVIDPLSERERDVLRYLPTVLTAHEIAADLNISVNTVKAHIRAIYRKLGAARRREAVVRARQTGLL